MAVLKGTMLVDSFGNVLKDNLSYIILAMPYSESYAQNISSQLIEKSVRSFISTPIYRIELLDNNESPFKDISSNLVESSLNYSQNLQSGQVRSLSFDVIDDDGSFFPSHVGHIWYGSKLKLSLGLLVDDTVIFFPKGVFAIKEASYKDNILSVQTADKFALIDGTISGTTESIFKIPAGESTIKAAIESLLKLDNGFGSIYDTKRVFFPTKYEEYSLPYTIEHNPESSIGEIIIELAKIISCVVYYDDYGHLTLQPFNEIIDTSINEIDWRYIDGECQFSDTNMDIKFPDIYNKVMVVGSVINGAFVRAVAENNNPASPTSIGNSPLRFKYIEDSNIRDKNLVKVRAEYELGLVTMLSTPISFNSIYIPFLTVNHLIEYSNDMIIYGKSGNKNTNRKVFNNEKLIITSINFSGDKTMNVSAKNIKELPFYG